MGLYDLIKKKNNGKEGEKVKAETREEFISFCESLRSEFVGIMRLYDSDEKTYAAAILLQAGSIVGATFEDLAGSKIYYGEEAIRCIRENMAGTRGALEVFSFDYTDFATVKEENIDALMSEPVPFSRLGMKVKSNIGEDKSNDVKGYFSLKGAPRITGMKVEKGFSLTNFAKKFQVGIPAGMPPEKPLNIPIKLPVEEEAAAEKPKIDIKFDPASINLGIPAMGAGGDLKAQRIAELKRKKQLENLELMKRMSKLAKKSPEKGDKKDQTKVRTSIDKLYQLVQKYDHLKIDNELADKLNVSRAQIESWAVILEEHNLVDLHYPAIGEPEIRRKK